MICCSIQNKTAAQILTLLKSVEMAEIRMDLCQLDDEDIEKVFSSDLPLIATCRTTTGGSYAESERRLVLAIKAGARYADLEIEAPKPVSKRIAAACAEYGTTFIRSYHDFELTPSLEELRTIADKCRHHDGEVVKIVTTAHSEEDIQTVEKLYKSYTAESLVAFCMAPADKAELSYRSRIACLEHGAPFSYAAMDDAAATAPGQMPYKQMYAKVYGSRKAVDFGSVRVPASKSYAQRAILCAALADGHSVLSGYSPCGDSEAAIALARSLGAKLTVEPAEAGMSTLHIEGVAAKPASLKGGTSLKVGESGLLTRLMVPLACEIFDGPVTIEGEGTLANRALDRLPSAVAALGGSVKGKDAGKPDSVTVPLEVEGPLKAGGLTMDGSKSSQTVSGAIMALPLSERNSTLHVKNPASIPYIFMTMDMLRKFGVKTRTELYGDNGILDDNWDDCNEIVVKIKENQRYKAADVAIEGDWSAAAVYMAAAAVFGSVKIDGLDTSSLQADISMLDLLLEAGASMCQLDEPNGTICIQKAPLMGIKADLSNCPDLFPVLAVFCAFCQGRSQLRGVHRLINKESDRAASITAMLTQMGVRVELKDDDMFIDGESLDRRILTGRLLKGGDYTSSHDHRMVMALRLAELGADSAINIDDVDCVAKSFPQFNNLWKNR